MMDLASGALYRYFGGNERLLMRVRDQLLRSRRGQ
jgi:hypothetical protein